MGRVLARGSAAAPRGEGEGEVVVVTVGDEEAEEGLRGMPRQGRRPRACASGTTRSQGADPLAVARVLAAAVERESPDLVLCGVQSSDAVNSATGRRAGGPPGPAARGGREGARLRRGLGSAIVERELEGGLVESLRVDAAGAAHDPDRNQRAPLREPAGDQAGQARSRSTSLSPADLGLDAEARRGRRAARAVRSLAPPRAGRGRGDARTGRRPTVAERIAEIVKERMSG